MTPEQIDDTDLALLLDIELLDSRIDAAYANQSSCKKSPKRKVFADELDFM